MKTCRALGCSTQVRSHMWGCGKHWGLVPKPLQRAVRAAASAYRETKKMEDGRNLLTATAVARVAVAEAEGRMGNVEATRYVTAGCGYTFEGAERVCRDLWFLAKGEAP